MLQSLYIDPAYQGLLGNPLPYFQERSQWIPGSVKYTIRRYCRQGDWSELDEGLLVYQYDPLKPSNSHVELHFCITGQVPLVSGDLNAPVGAATQSDAVASWTDTVDLISFRYSAKHLSQWARPRGNQNGIIDAIVQFKRLDSFRQSIPLNAEILAILQSLLSHSYQDHLENIFVNAQSQMLLLHSLDSVERPASIEPAPFLAHPSEREKIEQARDWLVEHIGEPITIKELSRKVAMNECYLKKGFRLMYGTTIFDFYQSQRMEHARYLLYEKELSVTEVSVRLGYSSISHFSTAFKKYTGLNPVDLLWREDTLSDELAQ